MKYLKHLLLFLPLSLGAQDFGFKPGYNLVWHDEFKNQATTFELWDPGYPWGQWTGGLAYFNREGNHAFDGDTMSIITKREYVNGEIAHWDEQGNYEPYYRDFDYSSGILYSKRSFLRGYFECKFRVPEGKGFNSAFWLYGPNDSEIDVFEILGSNPNRAQMTLHWRERDPLTNSTQSYTYLNIPDPSFADTYHTMGTLWDSTQVKFYHNGTVVNESTFTQFIRNRHVPNVPLNLILTTTLGGLDGDPDATTPFPAYFHVDYVRAYQNEQVVQAPLITAQAPLTYYNYSPFRINEYWLAVSNFYKTYPYGFRLEVLPGDNYTVSGQDVRVNQGFRSTLYVNVRVNDGIRVSPVYRLKMDPAQNVGLEEISIQQLVRLFPNPADDLVTVENASNEEAYIKIYGVDGRTVLATSLAPGSHQVDISGLEQGLYPAVVGVKNGKNLSYRINLMVR